MAGLQILSKAELEELKELFPIGCQVYCHSMDGEPTMSGRTGKLRLIDDIGQLHVAWEGGGSLALVPGVDVFWRADLTDEEAATYGHEI